MKKSILFISCLFFCGLAIAHETKELTGAEQKAVVKYAKPMMDNLLAGLNENSYEKYSRDFDAQMKAKITPQVFAEVQKLMSQIVGQYQSRKLVKAEEHAQRVSLVYKAKFTKEKEVAINVSFHKDGKHQVAGLWFNSPKLRNITPKLTGEKREAVLAYADPITDNLLAGFDEGNYQKYTRDFAPIALAKLPKQYFPQIHQGVQRKIGTYKSREVIEVSHYKGLDIVVYKAKYTQEDLVIIKILFQKANGKHLIVGQLFDSAKLRRK